MISIQVAFVAIFVRGKHKTARFTACMAHSARLAPFLGRCRDFLFKAVLEVDGVGVVRNDTWY